MYLYSLPSFFFVLFYISVFNAFEICPEAL